MTTEQGARWLCCHLGAREHYAVPRALHRAGRLQQLVTDAWVTPGSWWTHLSGAVPRRLSERYHPDLANARVRGFTPSLVAHEAAWRIHGPSGWDLLTARNRWFGARAAGALRAIPESGAHETMVFAHSYSAREVLAHAKMRGWTTVLGQIDPGPEHFRIVQELSKQWPEYGVAPPAPPAAYFESWRAECALSDRIVVNSEWSREALIRAGVASQKLSVIPLTYEPETTGAIPVREFPPAFDATRPLRVLFVGHVAVAKGVPALLEALDELQDVPIELRIVGSTSMTVPTRFLQHPAIRWVGAVPRLEVMHHYRDCDVLVFPSFSDGFGMAQVEARGWQLPVIASPWCGAVVADGVTGLVLPEVSAGAIAAALRRVAESPALLHGFAAASAVAQPPGLADLSAALASLESQ